MKTLSETVAENLIALRKKVGLTQQELADQLAYSDKTVSKWELGKAIPSVDVLKELADFYGVTIDYLISEHDNPTTNADNKKAKIQSYNHIIVLLLVATSIFLIATVIFVWTIYREYTPLWQIYVWAASITCFVTAFLVRRWHKIQMLTLTGKQRLVWPIFASLFVWSFLAGFYTQFLSQNIWYIFLIGVPIEILIIFIALMKRSE